MQIFFAKDLLEGVTTFPRIDNAQSYSFLELSCLYLKRILEMKQRKVQTLFVEGKPEPALASALLQARVMGLNVVIKLRQLKVIARHKKSSRSSVLTML